MTNEWQGCCEIKQNALPKYIKTPRPINTIFKCYISLCDIINLLVAFYSVAVKRASFHYMT